MKDNSLTRRRIVAYMAAYERRHGMPPTAVEIEAAVGGNVWRELRTLADAGRIHELPRHTRKYSALIG